MWNKTLTVTFKDKPVDVIIFLYETMDDTEIVRIQSMLNEYFLIEDVRFESRDAAYDFIKHYPASMARAFVIRTAYCAGAIDSTP